jgi:CubicO group peptidase (beta-lactamase class C family)
MFGEASRWNDVVTLPLTRRDALKGAGAILAAGVLGGHSARAATAFETAAPEAMGFAPDLSERFSRLQDAGRLLNVHGVVALRRGRMVFERYMAGTDNIWGRQVDNVEFTADTLHDMRSVTKSIVGLLYGIALGNSRVPAPDQSLLQQFPEYPELAKDPDRARLTIANALTMTMAMKWNEDLPWIHSDEVEMDKAPDRYRFALERPMLGAPGKGFIYDGGATTLLGLLIERGTGVDLHSFAKTALFEPMGIAASEWSKLPGGVASAASGLRLTPRDLARIGQLIVAGGKWEGGTVVPADWLEASFRPAAIVDDGLRYGYQWYLGELAIAGQTGTVGERWVGAFGLGGQRLFVFPELEFVLAVTAGNYATEDQARASIAILREVFLAGITV